MSDGEGRRVAFDTPADVTAVGVEVRQDDGSYDRLRRSIGENTHRLRMTDGGVTFGLTGSLVERSNRRLDRRDRDLNRGRSRDRDPER